MGLCIVTAFSQEVPDSLSLLQTTAVRVGGNEDRGTNVSRTSRRQPQDLDQPLLALPAVPTAHAVFDNMNSQMTALEARLTEVQKQSASALSKQKAKYELKLKGKRAE